MDEVLLVIVRENLQTCIAVSHKFEATQTSSIYGAHEVNNDSCSCGPGSLSRHDLTLCRSNSICSAPTSFSGRLFTIHAVNRAVIKLCKSQSALSTSRSF